MSAVPVSDGGLPWRYAPDGSVAIASPPKEIRVFKGKRYVLEEAINADFALVHAKLGDTHGNLVFNKTAMNFNPLAAMAGRITIAQVEELVEPGEIDPAAVHLAGVFVQRVVHTGPQDKKIEKRTVSNSKGTAQMSSQRTPSPPQAGTATRWPPGLRRRWSTASTSTSASGCRP